MKTSDFYYDLPHELIAQTPLKNRQKSKMMVLNKNSGKIEHKIFENIVDYIYEGDTIVLNDTKVLPARLFGHRVNKQEAIEVLLLKQRDGNVWQTLAKPGKKLKIGTEIVFDEKLLRAKVIDILEDGQRVIEFSYNGIFNEILDKLGLMPLPPYITEATKEDTKKYQTVYAKYDGSAAAPTAGLHFTKELLEKIKQKGVEVANVTLHVGIGTFRPVKVETVEEHQMHSEHYYIKKEDVYKINKTKEMGRKVIACGTTSCRVLESVADENGFVKEVEGDTNIFIYPGYKFKCIDSLITNFHLPESTLIMLVSSLAGKDFILKAYNEAVKEKYKFFSFGDAMIIK